MEYLTVSFPCVAQPLILLSLAKVRRTFDTPISSRLDDTYNLRRGSFDSQRRAYESPVRAYDTPRSYESPSRYDRPRSMYDSPKLYETKPYESPKYTYESPKYGYESPKYESPKSAYESPRFRYDSPVLQYESPRKSYESPRRYSISGKEEILPVSLKTPKIPYDRPSLLNKRDDSVKLTWLPASTYDLPDDARRISYVVESREVPSQVWTKLASGVPSTSYIVKHLRPDKEYEFRVRAQNQYGASEPTGSSSLEKRIG